MLDERKNTLHASRHPSLFPLRMALIAAERESPVYPPRLDANEQLALQLIARVQAEYKKVFPFLNLQDIPGSHDLRKSLRNLAGIDA